MLHMTSLVVSDTFISVSSPVTGRRYSDPLYLSFTRNLIEGYDFAKSMERREALLVTEEVYLYCLLSMSTQKHVIQIVIYRLFLSPPTLIV